MNDIADLSGVDDAVLAWWSAWQSKDVDTVLALALPDYLEFTGHSSSHRVGRDTLGRVAARAFAAFSIVAWDLGPRIHRRFGDLAVAAYTWESRIERDGATEDLNGVATDVLLNVDGSWRYLAHHSSAL